MQIPIDRLEPETLTRIIESYVLREGTDYGDYHADLASKIEQVHNQLKQGSAVLVYSELHESVNIMPADQLRSAPQENIA